MTDWKPIFRNNFITYYGVSVLAIIINLIIVKEARKFWGVLISLLLCIVLVALVSALMTYIEVKKSEKKGKDQ